MCIHAQSVFNNVYNDYSRVYDDQTYKFYNNDYFQDIALLPNGNILANGYSSSLTSFGDSIYQPIYLCEIQSNGDTVKTRWINENDFAYNGSVDALILQDSSIYIFGYTSLNLYENDWLTKGYMLKLDKNLNLQWDQNYYSLDTISFFQKAIYDVNENAIFTLTAVSDDTSSTALFSDVMILKLDTSGTILDKWQFGGLETDLCFDFKYLEDGTFLLSGLTYNNAAGTLGRPDIYILRVDTLGNVLWNRNIGYPGVDESRGRQALLLDDNSIYLVGRHEKMDGNNVGWLLKLNLAGDTIWTKMYDRGPQLERFLGIKKSEDGHLILLGSTRDYSFEPDIKPTPWLLKMDTNGIIIWDKLINKYPNDLNSDTYPYDIELAPDGGILLAGYVINNYIETDSIFHRNDAWLAKTDSCGFTVGDTPQAFFEIDSVKDNTVYISNLSESYCSATLDFGNGHQENIYAYSSWTNGKNPNQIEYTFPNQGNYTISLTTLAGENYNDFSINLNVPDYWTDSSQLNGSKGIILFPNPVKNTLTISHNFEEFNEFEIYNIEGKRILKLKNINPRVQIIDLRNQSDGVYFLRARTKQNTFVTEKFVIAP